MCSVCNLDLNYDMEAYSNPMLRENAWKAWREFNCPPWGWKAWDPPSCRIRKETVRRETVDVRRLRTGVKPMHEVAGPNPSSVGLESVA